ncbi:hypothetical protein [Gemmata sp. SH-PL17]|uniref:hypothetical protein n=1 Tax=Gemmata sp. SH-PL17 TaxID=1630693 RepID=UPI0004B25933|nr:hypothetical protein [Gemmata sp. SH-PL17]
MSLPAPAPYRLTFGRFKGSTLAECREDYLLWLSDFAPSPALRSLAKRHLGIDIVLDSEEEPRSDQAAVVLPGVVWRWNEIMCARFTEPIERLIVTAGLDELKRLTSEFTRKPWPNGGAA